MDNVKHTPGPWFSGNGNMPFNRIVKSQGGDLIAKVSDVCVGNVESNARLIAAAPELLEAARLCVAELRAWMNCHGEDLQTISAMKASNAAISKATGGA